MCVSLLLVLNIIVNVCSMFTKEEILFGGKNAGTRRVCINQTLFKMHQEHKGENMRSHNNESETA